MSPACIFPEIISVEPYLKQALEDSFVEAAIHTSQVDNRPRKLKGVQSGEEQILVSTYSLCRRMLCQAIETITWKHSYDCFIRSLRQKQIDRPDRTVFYPCVPIARPVKILTEAIFTLEKIISKPGLRTLDIYLESERVKVVTVKCT